VLRIKLNDIHGEMLPVISIQWKTVNNGVKSGKLEEISLSRVGKICCYGIQYITIDYCITGLRFFLDGSQVTMSLFYLLSMAKSCLNLQPNQVPCETYG
jgi:hypothetical protein